MHQSTPIGILRLVSNGTQLVKIEFEGQYAEGAVETSNRVLVNCAHQLTDYFAGKRQRFELPLGATGTPFQQSVWKALTDIPYGHLRSYKDIARNIDSPAAARAVGAASGRNPLPIVVPCHRVIGSNGRLTGFAGGLEAKRVLLQLEACPTDKAPMKNPSESV
ncbi:MAG: methylated-DNA--[protein]-cysteine S-methyltransferase [Halioglobus sp.]|nr:methylated-DNA--[protein]-cysteine S-methyltransferase [Halioglobus sp.]